MIETNAMTNSSKKSRGWLPTAIGWITAGLATLGAYLLVIRPWHLRWGATEDEVRRAMPGDDLVASPTIVATRAITIHTPARAVWPWLVQMGYRRAGWYSYDQLHNDGIRVERILPEFQDLRVGDVMLTGPEAGFTVEDLVPERHLVLMIREPDADISSVLVLTPRDSQQTRLVLRLRAAFRGPRGWLFGLLFDLGDFVMMRKMLLGIKERAEHAWVRDADDDQGGLR